MRRFEVCYGDCIKYIEMTIEAEDLEDLLDKFEEIANEDTRAGAYWWDINDIESIRVKQDYER